ncbi:MAG TPA: PfkB family carbohydrate kinase [Candidatus Hydrogenedentes bacterium]|nr:PfkB family carbohydrate kinase [Candidatus Hydrogenedentota bacterium]HOV75713.1 PfkB family carbohydrate kinase [Candidatus Hydrogenedentota bacterium]
MSLTVVGSIALDTVDTPWGRNEEGLGGAATYFSLAASHYTRVHLVGVVGEDFPDEHVALLQGKGIDLAGLERASGKTFRWTGRYHHDVNHRDTLDTQLNVFAGFHPKLPETARNAEFLFLGNIHPALQLEVLEQAKAAFVALDTMNLWIHTTRDDLGKVLARVDGLIINDSEVRDLTGEHNVVLGAEAVRALGPRIVVIKKGEHGCLLFHDDGIFAAPAFPLRDVIDPTGAGDTFAGGFMGHIAQSGNTDPQTLRQAVVHGSVVASYACEAFGPGRLAEMTPSDIAERFNAFRRLVAF